MRLTTCHLEFGDIRGGAVFRQQRNPSQCAGWESRDCIAQTIHPKAFSENSSATRRPASHLQRRHAQDHPPKNGCLSGWWGVGTGEKHSRIPSAHHVTARLASPTNKPLLPMPKICLRILLGVRKTKRHYPNSTTVTKWGQSFGTWWLKRWKKYGDSMNT